MLPSSSSKASTRTASGSSTSDRARYSRSSCTGRAAGWAGERGLGLLDALDAQEVAHLAGRLRTALEPVACTVLVDANRRRLGLRVVVADRLDDAAVARGARI